jgi:hypothetical protein
MILPPRCANHWLYPFRDKITSISVSEDEIIIWMSMELEDISLDFDNERMLALGIKTLTAETPIAMLGYGPYFEEQYGHTGELRIILTLQRHKANNQLLIT